MKRILCYGDSNTWGYIPGSGERFNDDLRWTGVLQNLLGPEYKIIEEGLSGRTIAMDEGKDWTRNGSKLLLPCLQSHVPLDLVVLMLGTNDVKAQFNCSAEKIARDISYLVRAVGRSDCGRNGSAPNVLLVAPPPLGTLAGDIAIEFDGGVEKSIALATAYAAVAEACHCLFFDAGATIRTSDDDGVHFDERAHHALGEVLSIFIMNLFAE